MPKSSGQRKGPSEAVEPPPGVSCRVCNSPDTSQMVSCDDCGLWHHFKCVDVDENVANVDWSCAKCLETRTAQGAIGFSTPLVRRETNQQSQANLLPLGEFNELRKQLELLQRRLDEQQKSFEQIIRQKDEERENALRQQKLELTQNLQAKDVQPHAQHLPNANSTAILNVNKERASMQLEMQLTMLEEKQALERKHLEERLKLQLGGERSYVEPCTSRQNMNVSAAEFIPLADHSSSTSNVPHELSRSQLAARQAIAKELPIFSGDPEEWPLFIASYESSTKMCGFSEEENLHRLQRSLKGKALEAVRSRLLYPAGIQGIINTLRILFGRPEVIVHSLVCRIRDMPSPKAEKLGTLIDFGIAVQNMCATIKACGLHEHLCNVALLQELVERLPSTIKLNWAMHRQQLQGVTLSDFGDWLEKLVEAACVVTMPSSMYGYGQKMEKRGRREDVHVHVDEESIPLQDPTLVQKTPKFEKKCSICLGSCSSTETCGTFLNMSVGERWTALKQHKLCRKCLKRHYGSCYVKKPCGRNGCVYMHNELLHDDTRRSDQSSAGPVRKEVTSCQNCNTHAASIGKVLFRYIPVTLYGRNTSVKTYAFLDDGSSATLMEHSLLQELELEGVPHPLCLNWTAKQQRQENESVKLALEISGTHNKNKKYQLPKVHTVRDLSLPRQSVAMKELANRYCHLKGLPVDSYSDVSPRILIGIDNCKLGNTLDVIEGEENEPTAAKTCLGWLVYGPCSLGYGTSATNYNAYHSFHICPCSKEADVDLQRAVKDYFSLDSLGVTKQTQLLLSKDDERANKLLNSLTRIVGNRYETGLLWKYENFNLPNSRSMAEKRLICLEKRMQNDTNLAETLKAQIRDYERKGYIRKLSPTEVDAKHQRSWYLPIFPVRNPNKPQKIRIVWDAAATIAGISLNSLLLKGPDQLTSLLLVLHRFREFRVAVTADIKEMFHQVMMNEADQQCQRFLWRDGDQNRRPDVYVMKVMTFGATCSPSSAQFVKNHNAERFREQFPRAAEAIRDEHYVDDMLSSVESEDEAIELARDVRYVHAQAGFEIRHWLSNSQRVVNALGAEQSEGKSLDIGKEHATEKVLGMWWCTDTDTFTFKVSPRIDNALLSGELVPTKRQVLRTLMMVYDPLGLIANFLMFLKILLQEIWRSGISWDEPIRDEQYMKWRKWLDILPQVESVSVPRCYRTTTGINKNNTIQLHVFVDASENGFAAVAYLRFEEGETIECALVGSKTRVAPLRFLSIPRLELQAAILGARLAHSIAESHKLKYTQRIFWTDSRDVLCWLNADHRKYNQFVAFRVSELLDLTDVSEWKWISTKQNVADEATKWQKPPVLNPSSRWFRAPDFLWRARRDWPASATNNGITLEELRPHMLHHIIEDPFIKFENFSKWIKLIRHVAFIHRFPENIRRRISKEETMKGPLTCDELQRAENFLYRLVQSTTFSEEIEILGESQPQAWKSKRTLPKRSPLYKLYPFIDADGILRMRGRIDACEFAGEYTKRPILLPKEHQLTDLIIAHIHERYCHMNHQTTLNEVRQKYHVQRLRSVYSRIRRNCQYCKLQNAQPQPPIMGSLPKMRLKPFIRPFSYIGIDYFGPMLVVLGRRVEKRWGVLITCMTSRAIHLEVAHSLTTDSCIIALRNFIARRGTPLEIISDRGTNFIGASRELKQMLEKVDQEKMMEYFVSTETKWSFNPPASPHFGGCWERLIQTVKKVFIQIKPKRLPTDEILRNMFAEIETIVNSRPLTEIPLENETSYPLTPNHLLLGSSNGSKPPIAFDDSRDALKLTWKMSQLYANEFWQRWVAEYLPIITRRTKWFQPVKPIAEGDIVIIVDNSLPRNCWPKGRVISVTKSEDGQVRRASVQTLNGILERPAIKLAVLDVDSSTSKPDL